LIKIILDKFSIKRIKTNYPLIYLKNIKDYIDCRKTIYNALYRDENLVLCVQNIVCCKWFWDLKEFPSIEIEEVDPCIELKKKLKVFELPSDIENYPKIIIELGSLQEQTPKSKISDVWSWMIGKKLGNCWKEKNPSLKHLNSLINWFLQNKKFPATTSDLLKKHVEKKKNFWVNKAKGKLPKAYRLLFKNPYKNSQLILAFRLLGNYPVNIRNEFISKLSPDSNNFDDKLFINLPDVYENPDVIKFISNNVKRYWNSKLSENNIVLENIIKSTSGKIKGELIAISNWLHKNPIYCTKLIIDKIRLHFKNINIVENILSELEGLVPPKYPYKPNKDWNWKEWSSWVVEEYLPYRSWLWKNKKIDLKIDQYSKLYSEWLYYKYPKFLYDCEPLVLSIFKKIKELVDNGYVVFFILIDNLSWIWGQKLMEIFKERNIHLINEPIKLISMLPSKTSISKLSILSGRPQSFLEKESYKENLSEYWKNKGNYKVRYRANDKNLKNLFSENAQIYIYQFDRLDSLAHDTRIIDIEHEINNSLQWLSDIIVNSIKNFPKDLKMRIVVSSDHGSTLIHKKNNRLPLPKTAVEDKRSKKHKRYIKIDLPDGIDEIDWFILGKNDFLIKENYAVAKGYSYLKSRPISYTHGGLSPEETVVPFLEFYFGKAPKCFPLEVVHRGHPILRAREQKIKLILKNPNNFPVSKISIRLPDYNIEKTFNYMDSQSEVETPDIGITLESKLKVKDGTCKIEGICSFKAHGRSYIFNILIDIKIREIFKYDIDSLEDLL